MRRICSGFIKFHLQHYVMYSKPVSMITCCRFSSNFHGGNSSTFDYYEILGIKSDATQSQIREAFISLSKKVHPDLHGGDEKMRSQFQKINEAYSVLSKPDTKASYDSMRTTSHRHSSYGSPSSGRFHSFEELRRWEEFQRHQQWVNYMRQKNPNFQSPFDKHHGQGGHPFSPDEEFFYGGRRPFTQKVYPARVREIKDLQRRMSRIFILIIVAYFFIIIYSTAVKEASDRNSLKAYLSHHTPATCHEISIAKRRAKKYRSNLEDELSFIRIPYEIENYDKLYQPWFAANYTKAKGMELDRFVSDNKFGSISSDNLFAPKR